MIGRLIFNPYRLRYYDGFSAKKIGLVVEQTKHNEYYKVEWDNGEWGVYSSATIEELAAERYIKIK